MEISTKNVIIGGVFSLVAACIGTISFSLGKSSQNSEIETTISQSGVITINQNENSSEAIERILDEYIKIQKDYNNISVQYTDLENNYKAIQDEYNNLSEKVKILESENISLNNTLIVQKSLEDDATPEIEPTKYLFDDDPYMIEYVKLYMRNNNRNTIYSQDSFHYDTGFRMSSVLYH